MKKPLAVVALLLVAAALVYVFIISGGGGAPDALRPSALAPADTAVYLELSNPRGSADRWQQTALAAIAREPQVAAFLEQPRASLDQLLAAIPYLEPLRELQAGKAFIAVSEIDRSRPRIIGGFRHRGDKSQLDAALAPARELVVEKHPQGTADLSQLAGRSVETFRADDFELAACLDDGWYFIANEIAALEQLLLRRDGEPGGGSLADSAAFGRSLARLPATRETLAYVDMNQTGAWLVQLSAASGQPLDPAAAQALGRMQAVAASTTFDGSAIRDAIYFLLDPAALPDQRLANSGLELTTADTLFYYTGLLELPAEFTTPDPALDSTGLLRPLAAVVSQLEARDLGAAAFKRAFGPEFSLHMDWAADSQRPVFVAAVDVADHQLARRIVDELASGNLGLPEFSSESVDDQTTIYSLPRLGRVPIEPALGLGRKRLLISDDAAKLRGLLVGGDGGGPRHSDNQRYARAAQQLATPDLAFGYLDSATVFTRTYNLLRPTLIFAAALVPQVGEHADLSKLPPANSVAKHLEPVVFSQRTLGDGVLYESRGTVTMNQFMAAGLGGAVGAGVYVQGLADLFGGGRDE